VKYKALVSSDWNECLAPCGPFDPISFAFPDLTTELAGIFRKYTGNEISLTEASRRISAVMPGPVFQEQMDRYLETSFLTYRGVPELIEWCLGRNILFMINTTGMQGYFQRVFAKKFLPPVPAVASNPRIRFAGVENDPRYALEVIEIEDKPKNTELVRRSYGIPPERIVVIGDSGGDGPHFQWAAENGAFLIGSMTKSSLHSYCKRNGISVHKYFGIVYGPSESRKLDREMQVNFMDLTYLIEALLDLPGTR
jgi:hypothetical protein